MSKLRLLAKIDSKKSLFYASLTAISTFVLISYKSDFEDSYILWILALTPIVFTALYFRETVTNLFNMDELERRIYLESICIATTLTFLVAIASSFIIYAGLLPAFEIALALPLLPVLMAIIIPFRAKAYDY